MKILAITACTAGIAHTYIAKEKIENAAKELGDEIKVETQGSIGVENELTPEEIADCSGVEEAGSPSYEGPGTGNPGVN